MSIGPVRPAGRAADSIDWKPREPSMADALVGRVGRAWSGRYRGIVERLLRAADAEHLVEFRDPSAYADWVVGGSLGMGESYMRGAWDSSALDELLYRLLCLPAQEKRRVMRGWIDQLAAAPSKALNLQSRERAVQVADAHYNLGNEFFSAWLDETMTYSCAYWEGATTLHEAQVAKQRLIAKKLKLEPGMRVLEIGSGWGGLASHLAKEHGVEVLGVTIAKEQFEYATERHRNVKGARFTLGDYRDLPRRNEFDRVVSVGMFEAVGWKNYDDFMQIAADHLRPKGVFVLHTIGTNRTLEVLPDRFIERYIFPNGFLPSVAQVGQAAEGRFVVEHVENIGPHYDRTLLEWNRSFGAFAARSGKLPEEFVRMWKYYLLSSAAGFRARATQLWQFVFTEHRRRAAR